MRGGEGVTGNCGVASSSASGQQPPLVRDARVPHAGVARGIVAAALAAEAESDRVRRSAGWLAKENGSSRQLCGAGQSDSCASSCAAHWQTFSMQLSLSIAAHLGCGTVSVQFCHPDLSSVVANSRHKLQMPQHCMLTSSAGSRQADSCRSGSRWPLEAEQSCAALVHPPNEPAPSTAPADGCRTHRACCVLLMCRALDCRCRDLLDLREHHDSMFQARFYVPVCC